MAVEAVLVPRGFIPIPSLESWAFPVCTFCSGLVQVGGSEKKKPPEERAQAMGSFPSTETESACALDSRETSISESSQAEGGGGIEHDILFSVECF